MKDENTPASEILRKEDIDNRVTHYTKKRTITCDPEVCEHFKSLVISFKRRRIGLADLLGKKDKEKGLAKLLDKQDRRNTIVLRKATKKNNEPEPHPISAFANLELDSMRPLRGTHNCGVRDGRMKTQPSPRETSKQEEKKKTDETKPQVSPIATPTTSEGTHNCGVSDGRMTNQSSATDISKNCDGRLQASSYGTLTKLAESVPQNNESKAQLSPFGTPMKPVEFTSPRGMHNSGVRDGRMISVLPPTELEGIKRIDDKQVQFKTEGTSKTSDLKTAPISPVETTKNDTSQELRGISAGNTRDHSSVAHTAVLEEVTKNSVGYNGANGSLDVSDLKQGTENAGAGEGSVIERPSAQKLANEVPDEANKDAKEAQTSLVDTLKVGELETEDSVACKRRSTSPASATEVLEPQGSEVPEKKTVPQTTPIATIELRGLATLATGNSRRYQERARPQPSESEASTPTEREEPKERQIDGKEALQIREESQEDEHHVSGIAAQGVDNLEVPSETHKTGRYAEIVRTQFLTTKPFIPQDHEVVIFLQPRKRNNDEMKDQHSPVIILKAGESKPPRVANESGMFEMRGKLPSVGKTKPNETEREQDAIEDEPLAQTSKAENSTFLQELHSQPPLETPNTETIETSTTEERQVSSEHEDKRSSQDKKRLWIETPQSPTNRVLGLVTKRISSSSNRIGREIKRPAKYSYSPRSQRESRNVSPRVGCRFKDNPLYGSEGGYSPQRQPFVKTIYGEVVIGATSPAGSQSVSPRLCSYSEESPRQKGHCSRNSTPDMNSIQHNPLYGSGSGDYHFRKQQFTKTVQGGKLTSLVPRLRSLSPPFPDNERQSHEESFMNRIISKRAEYKYESSEISTPRNGSSNEGTSARGPYYAQNVFSFANRNGSLPDKKTSSLSPAGVRSQSLSPGKRLAANLRAQSRTSADSDDFRMEKEEDESEAFRSLRSSEGRCSMEDNPLYGSSLKNQSSCRRKQRIPQLVRGGVYQWSSPGTNCSSLSPDKSRSPSPPFNTSGSPRESSAVPEERDDNEIRAPSMPSGNCATRAASAFDNHSGHRTRTYVQKQDNRKAYVNQKRAPMQVLTVNTCNISPEETPSAISSASCSPNSTPKSKSVAFDATTRSRQSKDVLDKELDSECQNYLETSGSGRSHEVVPETEIGNEVKGEIRYRGSPKRENMVNKRKPNPEEPRTKGTDSLLGPECVRERTKSNQARQHFILSTFMYQMKLIFWLLTFPFHPALRTQQARALLSDATCNGYELITNMRPVMLRGLFRTAPSIRQRTREMDCGCIAAPNVALVLIGLLIPAMILNYCILGVLIEEPFQLRRVLNFDYTQPYPSTMVRLLPETELSKAKGYFFSPDPDNTVTAVPPGLRFHVNVHLTMPENEYNQQLGIFQVIHTLSVPGSFSQKDI